MLFENYKVLATHGYLDSCICTLYQDDESQEFKYFIADKKETKFLSIPMEEFSEEGKLDLIKKIESGNCPAIEELKRGLK
jgi:hypothetical protein